MAQLEKKLNLAKKDEIPQKFTSEEMTEIKNAVSQETANVNVRPYHIYSPNEQVVGEWQEMVDGVLKKKPIYEKVIVFSSKLEVSYSSWGETNIDSSYMEYLLSVIGIGMSSLSSYPLMGAINTDVLRLQTGRNGNIVEIQKCIIQYTKTTDSWQEVSQ